MTRAYEPGVDGTGETRSREGTSSTQGFYFTAALLVIVLTASAIEFLPAHALPAWGQAQRTAVSLLWPQGWDFFAAEPSTNTVVVLRVGDDGRPSAVDQLQLAPSTDWGLSRSASALFIEAGNLSDQIPGADWLGCASLSPTQCEDSALNHPQVDVVNRTRNPALCGHLLVSVDSPVRWTGDTRLWIQDWKIVKIANAEITCAR